MESTEQAQGSTYFTSCCQPPGNPPPAASSHLCAGTTKRMSHPKTSLVRSLLTLTEGQPSLGRGKRLLPHLGSPGCTWVNPAPPPTPCELIRNIFLLGRSKSQRGDLQAGLWVWTCLVMSRSGLTIPVLLQCNPEFQKGMEKQCHF